ncbi:MAG TPA: HAMP domain-containing sensor histidine kinase [Vicinamibacterales bacterium]|jgi:signal transduction histidine kinase|nr:HAMP domain-containing sensor histidine kinase [Vicinamibacterales bacterium]
MTRRQKAIGFFITLCVLLVGAAILLNIFWIVISKTPIWLLVVGSVLFALIIAGIIVYTVFLVMEIQRAEEHDTFINAVTHELKTPLASIRLYLDTLKTRPVSDGQRQEFYNVMLADVERLHHTVDQVLKAGVVREKQRRAARMPLDIGELARECVDLAMTRHHLQPGAIGLEAHDGASLIVRGDAEELRTVITNLLDNAVKYSGNDVRVTVSLAAPAPDTIWVRVQDRGVGIPRKQLKRIFKRFYRVQALGIRQVKGTGLGLYIVRAIARAHGGRVFAQSEGEGRGATFTVELPRAAS